MARKTPKIGYTNPRRIQSPGDVIGRIRNIQGNLAQAANLVSDLKASGSEIYDAIDLPILDNITPEDPITESTKVMVDLFGVLAKTKFMADIIDATQRDLIAAGNELFIPVIGSEQVKKAISRTFPNSSAGHDKIYWNMWVETVRHNVRQSEFISSALLESLTGNNNQDAQILDDTLRVGEIELSKVVQQRNIQNLTNNIPNSGLGPNVADRGRVIKTMEESENASALKELLVYGAALIILYFLDRKLAIWKAPESSQVAVSSTLYPNPAGIGVMIAQIIIGLALHFIIEGLLADDVKTVISSIDIPGVSEAEKNDIVQAAQDLASGIPASVGPFAGKDMNDPDIKAMLGFKDGVLETAKAYFYRGDYDLIYNYGISWLAANANSLQGKQDYTQWLLLPEVEGIKYDLENITAEAPNFSKQFNDNAIATRSEPTSISPISNAIDQEYENFKIQATGENSRVIGIGPASFNISAANKALKDKFDPNDMLDELLQTLKDQGCSYNEVINQLAAVISHDPFIASAVCCFVRYFGAVDLKLLIALRSMLLIFSRGLIFDLGSFLNSMSSSLHDDLIRKARSRLISQVNAAFSKLISYMMDWADSESLDALVQCLPIEGLLKFMVSSVQDLELEFSDLINEYAESIEFQTMTLDSKLSLLEEQKWAKGLYTIIDAIIKVASDANTDCQLTGNPFEDKATLNIINGLLNNPTRQQNSHTYNIVKDAVDNQGSLAESGANSNSLDGKSGVDSGFGAGEKLMGIVHSANPNYIPGMQTDAVKKLLSTPSEFNTFTDIPQFFTQREVPINSIIANLRNKEYFQMTVAASTNPQHLSSCFQSIEQTEVLKRFLGKV